ncbi:ABC transporter substrate-binding protein [Aquabacter spiritensis]|uniref:Amino acid/amide ABC transporter substrate-binding protein (HAAT family) n=1 Tax=Aquabacter spiritensis TaxID=933073 RepID=A0A4R3LZT3_9HYPH|nr:ABC transporter substrate-binding protein [Aquabacter spiritensis]TCT06240.1 amino acid/amide ABC transporter substrate-binding protein (HAAT family) [Aquabacter spiritensis]
MTPTTRAWICRTAAAGLVLLGALPASAQGMSGDKVAIGAIVDMTGVYSRHGGPGVITAVQMAVDDFGGTVNGKPISVVSADYQAKVDVTSAIARRWIDTENVDMIIESTDSASALALFRLGAEKKRVVIGAGSATTALTNDGCMPYGIHYVYDTYALATGTGAAIVQEGGKSWYFITADYAFGHALEADTSRVVEQLGGKVLGRSRAPLATTDFSSYLLQAQASNAQVIGLANAGLDFVNSVKQASEFGITQSGQNLAAMLVFITDVKALGLKVAQRLKFTTGYYWDRDEASRAFAKKFYAKTNAQPSMVQAGVYSATTHYLNAIKATGTDDAEAVTKWMKANPVNDFFAKDGRIRPDGRMVHDMYLAEAKTPAESKNEWDLMKILRTIPADEAYRPLSQSTCPLVKKG